MKRMVVQYSADKLRVGRKETENKRHTNCEAFNKPHEETAAGFDDRAEDKQLQTGPDIRVGQDSNKVAERGETDGGRDVARGRRRLATGWAGAADFVEVVEERRHSQPPEMVAGVKSGRISAACAADFRRRCNLMAPPFRRASFRHATNCAPSQFSPAEVAIDGRIK